IIGPLSPWSGTAMLPSLVKNFQYIPLVLRRSASRRHSRQRDGLSIIEGAPRGAEWAFAPF
ncbi:MAG TPA: hypothetical protein VFT92_04665, partial [Nitrospira sp.]|nr:hypothetical protein [Nitrospira sp.]